MEPFVCSVFQVLERDLTTFVNSFIKQFNIQKQLLIQSSVLGNT